MDRHAVILRADNPGVPTRATDEAVVVPIKMLSIVELTLAVVAW